MQIKEKICFVAFLAFATPSQADRITSTCDIVALSKPEIIENQLKSYSSDVLGKPVIEWSREDFVNLSQNIFTCAEASNSQATVKINANQWVTPLNRVANDILPINDMNKAVTDAYKPYWTWSNMPSCQVLLNWERDAVWNTNNSKELFGTDFRHASQKETAYISGFVKECAPVATRILELNKMDVDAVEKIASDINRSIAKEQEAANETPNEIAPSLRVYYNGERIPLSYLGPNARKWITFLNKFEVSGAKMRVEDMVSVSKWTEAILAEKKDTPESFFAEAARSVITRRMFDQTR